MSKLFFFVLGMAVMIAGQSVAQNYWGSDSQGNTQSLYQLAPNTYGWSDSQGRTGMIQQLPSLAPQPWNPC